jgi:hypothetical protein
MRRQWAADVVAPVETAYVPEPPQPATKVAMELSFFPRCAPLPASPLDRALAASMAKPATAGSGRGGRTTGGRSRGASRGADQPVTFHAKIKSTGYGQAPVMKLHSGGPSAAAAKARAVAARPPGRGTAPVLREYVAPEGPMSTEQMGNSAAAAAAVAGGAALLRLAYSPDGSRLALADAAGAATLLRLPARRVYGATSTAMLCYAMLRYAMPCLAMPCHAMPCHAMPCHAMPCCAAQLRCAALRCAVLRCAVLRCAVLRCAVLCCAVLCCAVLCYAVPTRRAYGGGGGAAPPSLLAHQQPLSSLCWSRHRIPSHTIAYHRVERGNASHRSYMCNA